MSRFLFATIPAVGHTLPGLPIAQALINRGHSVRWYTGAAFADRITVIGATFCPMTGDDSSLVGLDDFYPGRREQSGIRRLQFDMLYAFARPMRTSLADLQALLNTESADLVVGDTGFGAGPILAELGGPPFAPSGSASSAFRAGTWPRSVLVCHRAATCGDRSAIGCWISWPGRCCSAR